MKLVVGLGNPGRKYEATRHNVGWDVLAELARKHATDDKPKAKFQGEVLGADLDGQRALLLAPHTYMNRSGQSVLAARDFYKIENEDILVVCDDFNLPLAKLRVRAGGSSGGQKGLEDVIRVLGDQFARLRIGVGSPREGWDPAAHVLGKFTKEEQADIDQAIVRASEAVLVWATSGTAEVMNRFN